MKNLCCGQKALILGGLVGAFLLWKKSKGAGVGSLYTNLRDSYKNRLKNVSVITKRRFPKDSPALRMAVNNTLDSIIREINYMEMREEISEARAGQLIDTLTNYAISLHR